MSERCPHCRGDISENAPLTRGRWWLHPAGAFLDDERLPLSAQQVRVLYALARANGEPVTHHDLPGCGEGTFAHQLRMIRKALGDRVPFTVQRNRGAVWSAPA